MIIKSMTETELLIQETIIYLLEIRKDYSRSVSIDDIGKVRTLTNAVELLHQYNDTIRELK